MSFATKVTRVVFLASILCAFPMLAGCSGKRAEQNKPTKGATEEPEANREK